MKVKFLDIKNVVVSIKAIASSIVTSLILFVPMYIATWLMTNNNLMVGRGVQILSLLSGLLIFGFLVRKWWGWR